MQTLAKMQETRLKPIVQLWKHCHRTNKS